MIGNSQENAPSTGHKILRESKGREVGRHGKIRSQYLFPITLLDVECQNSVTIKPYSCTSTVQAEPERGVGPLVCHFLPRTARGKGQVEGKGNLLIVEKPQTEGSYLCMDP